jgi:hypothetical protein
MATLRATRSLLRDDGVLIISPHLIRFAIERAERLTHGHSLVAAGFWIEEISEPQLTAEQKEKFPEKPAWLAR